MSTLRIERQTANTQALANIVVSLTLLLVQRGVITPQEVVKMFGDEGVLCTFDP